MLVSYRDNRLGGMLMSISPNKHIRMYNKINKDNTTKHTNTNINTNHNKEIDNNDLN